MFIAVGGGGSYCVVYITFCVTQWGEMPIYVWSCVCVGLCICNRRKYIYIYLYIQVTIVFNICLCNYNRQQHAVIIVGCWFLRYANIQKTWCHTQNIHLATLTTTSRRQSSLAHIEHIQLHHCTNVYFIIIIISVSGRFCTTVWLCDFQYGEGCLVHLWCILRVYM